MTCVQLNGNSAPLVVVATGAEFDKISDAASCRSRTRGGKRNVIRLRAKACS